jgi:hypothetical protein
MKNNLLIKGLFALLALASSAFAEVNYVRAFDIPGTFAYPIISSSQSPTSGVGAYRLPDAFSELEYAALDVSTGMFGGAVTYPGFLVNTDTVFAWVGQSPTGAYSFLVTRGLITVYSINDTVSLGTVPLSAAFSRARSLAAQSLESPVSLIAEDNDHNTAHCTVDPATGVMTHRPLAGTSATTHFMAYGADGLLYVLDYGNDRIASFDPANAFAPVGSFSLNPDPEILVANQQFAIGVNGSFYFADGQGGGSYYNSLGQFQGTFGLSEDAATASYTGASFINTDAEGNIFVYDSAKGLHQYQDTRVVPEPGTFALLGLGALTLLFRRRVIRPAIG